MCEFYCKQKNRVWSHSIIPCWKCSTLHYPITIIFHTGAVSDFNPEVSYQPGSRVLDWPKQAYHSRALFEVLIRKTILVSISQHARLVLLHVAAVSPNVRLCYGRWVCRIFGGCLGRVVRVLANSVPQIKQPWRWTIMPGTHTSYAACKRSVISVWSLSGYVYIGTLFWLMVYSMYSVTPNKYTKSVRRVNRADQFTIWPQVYMGDRVQHRVCDLMCCSMVEFIGRLLYKYFGIRKQTPKNYSDNNKTQYATTKRSPMRQSPYSNRARSLIRCFF